MRFGDFSDGLWLPEGVDFAVPPNALVQADNVEYTTSGGVRGRRGRSLFATLPDPVRSNWRHYPRSGTPITLVATDGGGAVVFWTAPGTSSTFTLLSGTFQPTAPWHFTNWPAKNKTFLTNGLDPMQSFDGTALTTVTSAGGAGNLTTVPNGPYVVLHKSRLWSTLPAEINYSVYASDVNDPTVWPAVNQISLNDPKGGAITGLASYFDFLIGLKSTSLWRFVGDIGTLTGAQLARYCDKGCIAPNSIAVTPWGVIFVGKDGVFLTDGVSPVPLELSSPIRSLFVGRDTERQYPNAVGTFYPRRDQYVLKLDPNAPEVYVLTRLNILYENPYIGAHSEAVWVWARNTSLPVATGTSMVPWFADTDDGRLLVGDENGNLWTADADNTATDNGTPVVATIQTASRALDARHGLTGRAYRVKALYRGTQPLTGNLIYDQHTTPDTPFSTGVTTLAAGEQESRTTLLDFAHMGRFLAVQVSNPSDSFQFELSTLDVDVRMRSPRVWRDTN